MRVAVCGGQGIGPAVTDAAVAVLERVADVETWRFEAGPELHVEEGVVVRDADLDAIRASDAVLFGASRMPPGDPSVVLTLRRALGLHTNVRPLPPVGDVDLVVYRELAEGLYVREADCDPDAGRHVDRRLVTEAGIDRFLAAVADRLGEDRSRVTLLHKANVVHGDTVWVDRFTERFPGGETAIVDSGLYRLVVEPDAFDAVVCPNLYGDVASDVIACHVGSLGLLPSASYGDGPPLYEPVHGTAPDIAGQGIADPAGAICSAAMLLEDADRPEAARAVRDAVRHAVRTRPTPDLGGEASTTAFAEAVLDRLEVAA